MITEARTVEDAITRLYGTQVRVVGRQRIGGGCIANGTRVELSDGQAIFSKQSDSLPARVFGEEAKGLLAMQCEDGPRVPRPLAVNATAPGGFILMEWIDSGRQDSAFQTTFAQQLARMHRSLVGAQFGFDSDNYIGSTEQPNPWTDTWCEFFAVHRIGFQARLARDRRRISSALSKSIDSLVGRMNSLLVEPDHPALIHGDLWSGNYLSDTAGKPVLIDPAVYYGHPEADLAMTELFGGFSAAFYRSYREESPGDPGYGERRDLYNLYHMLNHLNIFGGGYLRSVQSIVSHYS